MNQAASIMSVPSSDLYITFYPSLTASPTPLLGKPSFLPLILTLTINSQVAPSSSARTRSNSWTRCSPRSADTTSTSSRPLSDPRDGLHGGGGGTVQATGEHARRVWRNDGGDGRNSGLSAEEFHEVYMSWVEVDTTHCKLYKHAKYIYSETLLVLQFRKLCLDTAAAGASADGKLAVLKQLGQLMNWLQSCAGDFECPCKELDQLTQLAREAGRMGSRLTGAGWSGCTVLLVPESKVDSFIKKVSETYSTRRQEEVMEVDVDSCRQALPSPPRLSHPAPTASTLSFSARATAAASWSPCGSLTQPELRAPQPHVTASWRCGTASSSVFH
ncbi:GHMP-kinases-C domain-containing protein [Mycena venus]|uniref:GHMP-kinases-C domain-containing protein n=1 Tax=Mycena venus TaxID=2733690 RepID=A0A8H7DGN4_9AGAR|nr:GHMP-kinases-C domain-containing protein [Mycena venus]